MNSFWNSSVYLFPFLHQNQRKMILLYVHIFTVEWIFFTIYNMIFNQFNATGLNASNEKMIGFRDTQITSYHFSCRLIKANFIFSYKLLHCWEMRNVKNAKKHIFEVSAFNKHEDMKSQYNKRKLNAILNVHILYDMYVCNFNFL